ncbi:uncharacterized protein BKCO1_37000149 [Diplodia corticola]|uniref:Uncharacterized protein n=1 Tax=Diplodia corticola TaxID=236234 RepID=A0A1J9QWA2_9PEZI|nr:uncharacterized protein BKCO1_37000149 [Diplodia corticola]OJD32665.1 hypothetical protein BKCO1_37000149 [Diplodia corticola]
MPPTTDNTQAVVPYTTPSAYPRQDCTLRNEALPAFGKVAEVPRPYTSSSAHSALVMKGTLDSESQTSLAYGRNSVASTTTEQDQHRSSFLHRVKRAGSLKRTQGHQTRVPSPQLPAPNITERPLPSLPTHTSPGIELNLFNERLQDGECMRQDLERYRRDLQRERERNEDIEREKESILEAWKQAAAELRELRAARGNKVDDEYIRKAWWGLQYDVRNWADCHFQGKPKSKAARLSLRMGDDIPYEIIRLTDTSHCLDFLRSPSRRVDIAQAVVWGVFMELVFGQVRDGGFLWAGNDCNALRHLRNEHRPNPSSSSQNEESFRKYQAWMSLTTETFYAEQPMDSSNAVRIVCKKVKGLLGRYVCEGEMSFKQELQKIVARAIQLDREFHGEKAFFYCSWGYQVAWTQRRTSKQFNESTMEAIDNKASPVEFELTISPALFKRGTGSGENYGTRLVLVKSVVSSNLDEEPERALFRVGKKSWHMVTSRMPSFEQS